MLADMYDIAINYMYLCLYLKNRDTAISYIRRTKKRISIKKYKVYYFIECFTF